MKYAIIRTGGKQYHVTEGEHLRIETSTTDVLNEEYTNFELLAIIDGDTTIVGSPTLDNTLVSASIIAFGRAKKVHIFKMRRRKHYQKHAGHRQNFAQLHIESINFTKG